MKKSCNDYQDERISNIERHTEVMNKELGQCQNRLTKIEVILMRHDKLLWIITTGVIGTLIAFILNIHE